MPDRTIAEPTKAGSCRLGKHVYDTHAELNDAIEHCKRIAADHHPAEVFVHRRGSEVEHVASF